LSDKLTAEDKSAMEDIVKEGIQFVESNPDVEAEQFEAKQRDLEAKFNPIMQKIYQQSNAPNGAQDTHMRDDNGYGYQGAQ